MMPTVLYKKCRMYVYVYCFFSISNSNLKCHNLPTSKTYDFSCLTSSGFVLQPTQGFAILPWWRWMWRANPPWRVTTSVLTTLIPNVQGHPTSCKGLKIAMKRYLDLEIEKNYYDDDDDDSSYYYWWLDPWWLMMMIIIIMMMMVGDEWLEI